VGAFALLCATAQATAALSFAVDTRGILLRTGTLNPFPH
jgi:hypothetical protein